VGAFLLVFLVGFFDVTVFFLLFGFPLIDFLVGAFLYVRFFTGRFFEYFF
jgi:hypothetical protein